MKKLTILASAIALIASASAFAVTAQSGVYVQGTGGWAVSAKPGIDDQSEALLQATKLVNKTYALGANIGYDYALNQNVMVGIEGGYLNLGSTNYEYPTTAGATGSGGGSYGKTQNWGYQVLATGTYLMSNGFNGFVKAGGIKERSTMNFTSGVPGAVSAYSPESQTTKWVPAAVIGAGYMPTQNINIVLQYEHVFGDKWSDGLNMAYAADVLTTYSKPMTQNIVSLGVSYKFAM
ncbi:MAG: outer membrane beta-barrel protein [Gammaproteobacteria bacterium]|nr:outer membrane beta-barrel protein [Gammaproteobacteria bacterium]